MTDAEKIKLLRDALKKCGELFLDIRRDWTDPRYECREGARIIGEALKAIKHVKAPPDTEAWKRDAPEPDLASILGDLTNLIQNERVKSYNEGFDAARAKLVEK